MLEWNGYKIKLEKRSYEDGQFALLTYCWDEEYKFWEPYATITVNLNYTDDDPAPEDCAYIDTNNVPDAPDFIKDFAEDTGKRKQSGYCTYPLFKFDMQKIDAVIKAQEKEG